jgi:hypothetical protein
MENQHSQESKMKIEMQLQDRQDAARQDRQAYAQCHQLKKNYIHLRAVLSYFNRVFLCRLYCRSGLTGHRYFLNSVFTSVQNFSISKSGSNRPFINLSFNVPRAIRLLTR